MCIGSRSKPYIVYFVSLAIKCGYTTNVKVKMINHYHIYPVQCGHIMLCIAFITFSVISIDPKCFTSFPHFDCIDTFTLIIDRTQNDVLFTIMFIWVRCKMKYNRFLYQPFKYILKHCNMYIRNTNSVCIDYSFVMIILLNKSNCISW